MPLLRNRRTLAYDAVSTSVENVDNGFCVTVSHPLSSILSYASVLKVFEADSPPAKRAVCALMVGVAPVTVIASATLPTFIVIATSRVKPAATTAVAVGESKPARRAVTV